MAGSAVLIGFRDVDLGCGIETERVMWDDDGFFCVVRGLTVRLSLGSTSYVPEEGEGRAVAALVNSERLRGSVGAVDLAGLIEFATYRIEGVNRRCASYGAVLELPVDEAERHRAFASWACECEEGFEWSDAMALAKRVRYVLLSDEHRMMPAGA